MLPGVLTNINVRAMAGFALLTLLAMASAAHGKRAKSPAQATAEHLQALSASSNGTMEIYYDYIDDGILRGGKLTVESPSAAAVQTLAEQPLYDFHTLIDNGPCDNRIDLVFVGDGYTAGQMDLYRQHVQNVIDGLLQEPPLNRYASYFNVHVVEVISNESGVDVVDENIYRDTPLDMAFNGRALSVDFIKAWNAANHAPDGDFLIALANSSRYGGLGYSETTCTVSGANASAVELALHEFGHAFAKLADEYYDEDGSKYEGSELTQANASIYTASEMAAAQVKWYRWLDAAGVSTFEGALDRQYDIYRPVGTSKMQALGYPYGPVNSEQFVFKIYTGLSPIDQTAPATGSPVSAGATFSVSCQLPVPDTLAVSWQIDGVTVPDADRRSFCPADATEYLLPNTLQTLTVVVTDTTTLVRDEGQRAELMTDQRQWQIWTASADVADSGMVALNGLIGIASSWLSDDPAYDIAPAGGGDGVVNMQDFSAMAAGWNDSPDLAPDGVVDEYDLMAMAAHWMMNDTAYDIAPAGGDGVVNLHDFAILTAQWTGP